MLFQQYQVISLPSAEFQQRSFKLLERIRIEEQQFQYKALPMNWGNFNQEVILKFYYSSEMNETEKQFILKLRDYQNKEKQACQLQQSQIVEILDAIEQQNYFILIMEQGQIDLCGYLKKQDIKILEKIKIMKQISKSIQFLHFNKIIHRDIKPENFMKFKDEFKLANFCLVKEEENILKTLNIGTKLFQAPEMQNGQNCYSYPVDIWSLGGTFYEILTNQDFNINNIHQLQIKNKNTPIPIQINQLFIQLLENMIQNDPRKRIEINKVIENLDQIEKSIWDSYKNSTAFTNKPNSDNLENIENNLKEFIIKQMDEKLQNQLNVFQQSFSQFQNQFTQFIEQQNNQNIQGDFQNQINDLKNNINKQFNQIQQQNDIAGKQLNQLLEDQKVIKLINKNQDLKLGENKKQLIEQFEKQQQQKNENYKILTQLIQDQNKNEILNEIIQQNKKQEQLLLDQFRYNQQLINPNQEQFDKLQQQIDQNQQQLLQQIKSQNLTQILNDQLILIKLQNKEEFNKIIKQINDIQQQQVNNKNISDEYNQQLTKLINDSQLNYQQKSNQVNFELECKQFNESLIQIKTEMVELNSNLPKTLFEYFQKNNFLSEQITNINKIQMELKNFVDLMKKENAKVFDQKSQVETRNVKQQQDNTKKQVDQLNKVEKEQQKLQQQQDKKPITNQQPQQSITQVTNHMNIQKNNQDNQQKMNQYKQVKQNSFDQNKIQNNNQGGNLDQQKLQYVQQRSTQKEPQYQAQTANQNLQFNYMYSQKPQQNYNPTNQYNQKRY